MIAPARRHADASAVDRAPFVDRRFVERVAALQAPSRRAAAGDPLVSGMRLGCARALELFRAQVDSRHLDLQARELKQRGAGFYTIGSSGHEGNAAVAAALMLSDPALLHYRSGAFFLERARQAGLEDAALHVLLGVTAAADEPIAGGRHKVFGSRKLNIPPQTSTIASHLPKAMGMAFALDRMTRLGQTPPMPANAIVMASFGDASVNHSTLAGAVNAACWAAFQGLPMPLLLVCEDNGVGISVPTPPGWVEATFSKRPELAYFAADGLHLAATYEAACEAVRYVRDERRPALLHLAVVRLLGHAGSDMEMMYRSLDAIETTEERDPLLVSARLLVDAGAAKAGELVALYEESRGRIARLGDEAARRPRMQTAAQVVAPIAPRDDEAIAAAVAEPLDEAARAHFWGGTLPEAERPAPLGATLTRAIGDLLVQCPELLVFGEDVARKGGVYGVTRELWRRARRGRVFDTLLDEQSILGIALGAGQLGLLPMPEIQYLAYLHNAEDQLRGEAATLQFFSQGQFKNPMVVRVASYAYQKGFGGHFHNDNSVSVLRDVPGVVVASPARGEDAVAMLQTCVAAARTCGSVCVFLEPIALYPTRDLFAKGDGGWCTAYDPRPTHVPIGKARVHGDGRDLLIVSWANGLYMSLRVQKRLAERHGIEARVLDLRWLSPLPVDDLLAEACRVTRVLVVDETRRSGGVSEAVFTALVEGGFAGRLRRLCALDSFVPLGDAANLVLVQEDDIERAAVELVRG